MCRTNLWKYAGFPVGTIRSPVLGHCRRAAPRRVAELGGMSAARKRKVELEEEEVGQEADAEKVQTLKEMFPAVPIRLIKVG